MVTIAAVEAYSIPRTRIGLDLFQLTIVDSCHHLLMVLRREDLRFQIGPIAVVVQRRLPVVVQAGRVVVVVPVAGGGPGPHGDMHHGIHAKERDLVPFRRPAQEVVVDQRLTGDDEVPGSLGLLHIGKGQAVDAGGSLSVGGLYVNDGDIRVDRRYQHHPVRIAPAVERVVHDDQFTVGNARICLARGFREAPPVDDVRPQRGTRRQERHAHGTGHETQRHLIVGVVLDRQLPGFDRFAEPDAGGREPPAAGIGDLELVHAAGPDQFVDPLAVGMGVEMQAAFFLANDFIHRRHGIAIDGKSADGDVGAVGDESGNGVRQGHQLVVI